MDYKDAEKWATAYAARLQPDDQRSQGFVHVVLDDGSTFFWRSAFHVKLDRFLVVFTRHYGIHVFRDNDVYAIDTLKRVEPETFKP